MSTRRPRRTISPERKKWFAIGTALLVAGGLTIAVGFVGFALAGQSAVSGIGGSPFSWWFVALIGIFAAAGGRVMRTVSARGLAGSGVVLDPERAHRDLQPWAQTGGGLLRDVIEESGLQRGAAPDAPAIKVRCRSCQALNDETARFCSQCAAALA